MKARLFNFEWEQVSYPKRRALCAVSSVVSQMPVFFVNSNNISSSFSLICSQSLQTRLFLSAFLQSNQLQGSHDSIWKWYPQLTDDKNQHLEILHNQKPSSVRPWLRRLIYRARETDWEIRVEKKAKESDGKWGRGNGEKQWGGRREEMRITEEEEEEEEEEGDNRAE